MTDQTNAYSRRDFLKTTGSLTIGFCLWDSCSAPDGEVQETSELPGSLSRQPNINAWIEILADGRVRVSTGKLELGQGVRIAVAQVAAEELNIDINRVEVRLAATGLTPDEGYTAGSRSMEGSAMAIRYAAAAAKEKILGLAATRLSSEIKDLTVENGEVVDKKTGTKLSFAKILDGAQIVDEIQSPVKLKSKSEYSLVGKPIHRKDIQQMARGEQIYTQDLRFPDMIHARIVRPPNYQAELKDSDIRSTKKLDGILEVVKDGNFLAVIAEGEYQAIKASKFLKEHSSWSDQEIYDQAGTFEDAILDLPTDIKEVKSTGSTDVLSADEGIVSAQYQKPYLMHASVGTSCAVAIYENDKLQIWSHTQGVYPLKEAIRKMLNLNEEQIEITGVPGSGCYGHNGADDVAADVALLAMAYQGKHIRLQWSREDEHTWEPYGSAMVMKLKAKLNRDKKITHWSYDLWSDAHSTRPGGNPERLLAARHLSKPFAPKGTGGRGGAYRNSDPYYQIPNLSIKAHFFNGPLRVSALRSLGAFANIFAIESFFDELAQSVATDPLTFRLKHLTDQRAIAVVKKIRNLTKTVSLNRNEGLGFAFSRYKNVASYFACAVKVLYEEESDRVLLQKMWGAIDSGEVINPDGLKNQTEGGMIQAASWTLMEQVTFDNEKITSADWGTYPILRFDNIPEMKVEIIDHPNEPVMGAGEAAQGPTAAAIANAVYNATGKRIRKLPIRSIKG